MKKVLSAAISLLLCFVILVGCGADTGNDASAGEGSGSSTVSTQSDASKDNLNSSSNRLTEEQIKMTAYLGNFSDRITEITQKTEGQFVFGLQSDTHHSDTAEQLPGRNMAAMSHFIDLKFVGNLGDIVRGYSVQDIDSPENMRACMDDMVNRYLENAKCPVIMTVGNHDTNAMWCNKWGDHTTQITPEEQKTRIFDRLKEYNGDKMVTDDDGSYYYIDYPEDGIRVIVLNTSNDTYDGTKMCSTSLISEKQIEWFKTEALNTSLQVIVMSHIPFTTAVEENTPARGSDAITAAVEEFIANGGQFIAYCCGHKHGKSSAVDENGRLHIVVPNGGKRGAVIAVDTQNKTISIYGLGGAGDATYDYVSGQIF